MHGRKRLCRSFGRCLVLCTIQCITPCMVVSDTSKTCSLYSDEVPLQPQLFHGLKGSTARLRNLGAMRPALGCFARWPSLLPLVIVHPPTKQPCLLLTSHKSRFQTHNRSPNSRLRLMPGPIASDSGPRSFNKPVLRILRRRTCSRLWTSMLSGRALSFGTTTAHFSPLTRIPRMVTLLNGQTSD